MGENQKNIAHFCVNWNFLVLHLQLYNSTVFVYLDFGVTLNIFFTFVSMCSLRISGMGING